MDPRVHMYIPDLNTQTSVTCSTIINGLKLYWSCDPINLPLRSICGSLILPRQYYIVSRSLCLASRVFLPFFTGIAFFFIHLGSLPSVKVVKSYCSMTVHLSTSIVIVTDMNQQTKSNVRSEIAGLWVLLHERRVLNRTRRDRAQCGIEWKHKSTNVHRRELEIHIQRIIYVRNDA